MAPVWSHGCPSFRVIQNSFHCDRSIKQSNNQSINTLIHKITLHRVCKYSNADGQFTNFAKMLTKWRAMKCLKMSQITDLQQCPMDTFFLWPSYPETPQLCYFQQLQTVLGPTTDTGLLQLTATKAQHSLSIYCNSLMQCQTFHWQQLTNKPSAFSSSCSPLHQHSLETHKCLFSAE